VLHELSAEGKGGEAVDEDIEDDEEIDREGKCLSDTFPYHKFSVNSNNFNTTFFRSRRQNQKRRGGLHLICHPHSIYC
jgi:hypothetical protein